MTAQKAASPLLIAAVASSILGAFLAAGAVGAVYVYRTTGAQAAPLPAPAPTADWAALIPEARARADLAAFFRDLATATKLSRERIGSLAVWRDAYRLAAQCLQADPAYPSVAAAEPEFDRRLREAVGAGSGPIPDQPLTPELADRLAAGLNAISAELRGSL